MIIGLGTDTVVVTGVMILTGVFITWLGYRIRYRGDVHLIAGYQNDMSADTGALSQAVGGVVLAIAAVTVLVGLIYPVLEIGPTGQITYWFGYIIVVLVLSGYAVVTSRRYVSDSNQ